MALYNVLKELQDNIYEITNIKTYINGKDYDAPSGVDNYIAIKPDEDVTVTKDSCGGSISKQNITMVYYSSKNNNDEQNYKNLEDIKQYLLNLRSENIKFTYEVVYYFAGIEPTTKDDVFELNFGVCY